MHKVITPSGILDGQNATQLRRDAEDYLTDEITTVVLNLEQVTFINSSAIGAMVALLKKVRSQGKDLVLCSLNAQIKMIFELTRMEQVFKIFESVEDFEQQLEPVR